MLSCPSAAAASMPTDRVDDETEQTDDGVAMVRTRVAESAPQAVTAHATEATASRRMERMRT